MPWPFYSQEKIPQYPMYTSYVGPTAWMDTVAKREILVPTRNWTQLVAITKKFAIAIQNF
jgi:hypothetical protein